MAKPKKQTREERLRKKRLAEKKRYENIKNNAELWAEKQEKNRKSYLRRKEQKKQLSINEMRPREQRLQRKRWRTSFKTYYLKQKQEKRTAALIEQNTPPQSPNFSSDIELIGNQTPINVSPSTYQPIIRELESPVPGPSRITRSNSAQSSRLSTNFEVKSLDRKSPFCSSPVSSAVRRIRYKKDKEINHLKQIIVKMRRQNERYKKQIQRIMPAKIKERSPPLTDPNTCRMKQKVKHTQIHNLKSFPEVLRKQIEVFFEDDENSRLCSGKKECITRNKVRKQKRYISDTLRNLHEKFLKTSSYTVSYSAFCKMRPFWVLLPDIRSRDTCLCKLHTNFALIIQALYQRKILITKTSQDFLSLICCDVYNVDCLHRTCSACKNKAVCYQEFDNSIEITYWQWETKENTIQGTARKIRTTEKLKKREEPKKCIEKLESTLDQYLMHCGNIVAQQKAFKHLKEHLQEGECIIHIDYSENYAVKCTNEIQAYHFGGSRKQITLHTSVIYYLDDEKIQQVQSFCTVSECLRHDISAVWAHVVPILEYIGEIKSGIHTVHFISDSPSSQYRNKKVFHLISYLHIYLSSIRTISWNYSESGHGKGAPDGVGAIIKRTADRAVSQGQDIKDLDDFLNIMKQNLKKTILRTVSEYDVSEKDLLFPQKVKAFSGCMKMHQIVWNLESPEVAVRKLSCIDQECLYQAVRCNHMNHLGFYRVEEVPHILPVTPLINSTRQLREIGESFWTMSNKMNEHQDISGTSNKTVNKEGASLSEIDKTTLIWNCSHSKSKSLGISNTQGANGKGTDRADRCIQSTGDVFDNISEINFSRDGNQHFSIDLENVNPYLLDSDDEDLNIFLYVGRNFRRFFDLMLVKPL